MFFLCPLNGDEIQPGRLGLVLLLCSVFSWIFLDLFIALYGEMICLNSSKSNVNHTGLYPTSTAS